MIGFYQCVIGYADDTHTGVTLRIAKSVELLQVDGVVAGFFPACISHYPFQTSFLPQYPCGGFVQRFAHLYKTAGQAPVVEERVLLALDQEGF